MKINYLNNTPRKVIDSDDLPDYMSENEELLKFLEEKFSQLI